MHIELNREFFVSWQLATHNSCAANEFYPTFWPSSPSAPLSLNSHHHLIIENTPPSKIQPSLDQGDQRFRLVSQLCCQPSFNCNLDLCGPKSKRPLRSQDIVNIYFPTLRFLLRKITFAERNRLFQDLFCWLVEGRSLVSRMWSWWRIFACTSSRNNLVDIPCYAPPPKKVHITIEREDKSGQNMAKKHFSFCSTRSRFVYLSSGVEGLSSVSVAKGPVTPESCFQMTLVFY